MGALPSRSRMRASGPAAMIAGHLVYVRNQFGGYDPEKRPHDMPHVGRPDPRVEGLRSSRCRSPSSRNAIRPRSPRGSGPKASTPNTGDNAFEGSGIPAKSWIFAEGVPAEAGGHSRNSGGETMWVLLIVLVGSAGVATTIIPGYPTKAECEAARAQIHRVPDLINLPQGQCVPGPGAR